MSTTESRAQRRAGFTLLEILVVVLIITILATVVGVNVAQHPDKARVAAARTQIVTFKTALQMYRMDGGGYPTQDQGLGALCRRPESPPVPDRYPEGGYMDATEVPPDPWGRPYVYLAPGRNGEPFEVLCYGADGEPGGEGVDEDISSSQ